MTVELKVETVSYTEGNFELIMTYNSVGNSYNHEYVCLWTDPNGKKHVVGVGSGSSNAGSQPEKEDLVKYYKRCEESFKFKMRNFSESPYPR